VKGMCEKEKPDVLVGDYIFPCHDDNCLWTG
jgi:hypothetical protein